MTDFRYNDRNRVLLRGKISFNSNLSLVDCTVRNISSTGAKIDVSKEHPFPNEFILEIPAKKQTVAVRLVWRNAVSAGVEFVEAVSSDDAEPTRHDAMEKENRRLKSALHMLVKQLEDLGQDRSFLLGDRQI